MAKIMKEIFSLENKTAIITGGTGHLGTAMTLALSEFGANVVVAGRNRDKFNSLFSQFSNIKFSECNILDSESIGKTIKEVNEENGRIDIYINNAHALKGKVIDGLSDEDWSYSLDGVLGPIHKSIKVLSPIMKKQHFGKIINISSMYGLISPDLEMYKGDNCEKYTNPPHYGAAKAAIIQLTKYYAVELGKYNIQVNSVSPGPFPKRTIQEENPIFIERLKKKNPLNKIGSPNDLIGVIIMLSSEASSFITGQNISIDGGWTIW